MNALRIVKRIFLLPVLLVLWILYFVTAIVTGVGQAVAGLLLAIFGVGLLIVLFSAVFWLKNWLVFCYVAFTVGGVFVFLLAIGLFSGVIQTMVAAFTAFYAS